MMVGATRTRLQPRRRLLRGSEAIAEAMVVAGCRFFSGYPMTPFTEVLEEMAKKLPAVGGVCMNAESELEAVGMAWGAAATGTPAATGSTGQGLSLMQESLAEITLARLPLVVLNMARAQGDYWQATRGGGHGDYRHLVLAPVDVAEAVELVQRAFHLAATWRNPVVIMGDYYLAHTARAVEVSPLDELGPLPPNEWALDGRDRRFGTGQARLVPRIGQAARRRRLRPFGPLRGVRRAHGHDDARGSAEAETGCIDDADVVVVAFGTPGRLRAGRGAQPPRRGRPGRLGPARDPGSLSLGHDRRRWRAGAKAIAVFENNTGQMLDDVRLAVLGDAPVEFIGGMSLDQPGSGSRPISTSPSCAGVSSTWWSDHR